MPRTDAALFLIMVPWRAEANLRRLPGVATAPRVLASMMLTAMGSEGGVPFMSHSHVMSTESQVTAFLGALRVTSTRSRSVELVTEALLVAASV